MPPSRHRCGIVLCIVHGFQVAALGPPSRNIRNKYKYNTNVILYNGVYFRCKYNLILLFLILAQKKNCSIGGFCLKIIISRYKLCAVWSEWKQQASHQPILLINVQLLISLLITNVFSFEQVVILFAKLCEKKSSYKVFELLQH